MVEIITMPVQVKPLENHKKHTPASFVRAMIFSACLIVFSIIAYYIVYQHHDVFDLSVISYFSHHRSPGLIDIMHTITFFGSSMFLLPAYLGLIGYLLIKRRYHYAIAVALTSFISWVVLSETKILFHRHRPLLPLVNNISTFSFPSAHAYSSMIFFSTLAFIVAQWQITSFWRNALVVFLLVCPLAVGLSRIMLNVHYTTDVIAGYCLGIMWLILSYMLFVYRKRTGL